MIRLRRREHAWARSAGAARRGPSRLNSVALRIIIAYYAFVSVAFAHHFYRTLPAQFRQNTADGARSRGSGVRALRLPLRLPLCPQFAAITPVHPAIENGRDAFISGLSPKKAWSARFPSRLSRILRQWFSLRCKRASAFHNERTRRLNPKSARRSARWPIGLNGERRVVGFLTVPCAGLTDDSLASVADRR